MSDLIWAISLVLVAIVAGRIGFKMGDVSSLHMLKVEPEVRVKYRVREYTKFERSDVEVKWTSGNPAIHEVRDFMDSVRNSRDDVVRAAALALDGKESALSYLKDMRKAHSAKIAEGMKPSGPYGRFLAYEIAHDNPDVPTPDLIHPLI